MTYQLKNIMIIIQIIRLLFLSCNFTLQRQRKTQKRWLTATSPVLFCPLAVRGIVTLTLRSNFNSWYRTDRSWAWEATLNTDPDTWWHRRSTSSILCWVWYERLLKISDYFTLILSIHHNLENGYPTDGPQFKSKPSECCYWILGSRGRKHY